MHLRFVLNSLICPLLLHRRSPSLPGWRRCIYVLLLTLFRCQHFHSLPENGEAALWKSLWNSSSSSSPHVAPSSSSSTETSSLVVIELGSSADTPC
ncbi:hypothetical protein MRB53_025938 [Persea americana]|uniref:Uncharacterized protein n=1 Tax=Persea americana TaxID=3435 RepID=A0ACC2LGU1_PERAE|nr:hypothetical protein MRB53_025938 [Persea americana]